jgi:class 3 adenylate cyclase
MVKTARNFNPSFWYNSAPPCSRSTREITSSPDLWGDAVNKASPMESHGIPGKIQVSETTYHLLQHQYKFEERGLIEIKGKGEMKTYFLTGRHFSAL